MRGHREQNVVLRIIGAEPHVKADEDYVLLQNSGVLSLELNGHALLAHGTETHRAEPSIWHIFRCGVIVPPKAFVMLKSGFGPNRIARTPDGYWIYVCHAGQTAPLAGQGITHMQVLTPGAPYCIGYPDPSVQRPNPVPATITHQPETS